MSKNHQDLEFFKTSKEIVENYLQSVVIIDDQFAIINDNPVQLKTPKNKTRSTSEKGNEKTQRDPINNTRVVDVQEVVKGFAEKGIICSIYPFQGKDKIDEKITNLAIKSDVVIIDWSLLNDNGELCLELLKRIEDTTNSEIEQIKLIVIYTAEGNIGGKNGVSENILGHFTSNKIKKVDDDDLRLSLGSTHIVILAKKGTKVPIEYEDNVVSNTELAEHVSREFTLMTMGIVSNTVIKALSQVRKNSFKLISKFSRDLDAPYLTHRSSIEHPEDAEGFLVQLIASEFLAILDEGNISDTVKIEILDQWVIFQQACNNKFKYIINDETKKVLSEINLHALFEQGIKETWGNLNIGKPNAAIKGSLLTNMLNNHSSSSEKPDEKFAIMTTTRTFYEEMKPRLISGTIIKDANKKYWVCIQPLCDCGKIENKRAFPFLPLVSGNKEDGFDTILKDDKEILYFQSNKKPQDLKMITFEQKNDSKNMIYGEGQKGKFYFQDTDQKKYTWVGELKHKHALRISNVFAGNLSRVGVDESEWLRLHAK